MRSRCPRTAGAPITRGFSRFCFLLLVSVDVETFKYTRNEFKMESVQSIGSRVLAISSFQGIVVLDIRHYRFCCFFLIEAKEASL